MTELAIGLGVALSALAATSVGGWQIERSDEAWAVTVEPQPLEAVGLVTEAVVVRYPGQTTSQPGQFGAATTTVGVPAGRRYELTFVALDSFTGPTAGYHFLQARVADEVVWEHDAVGPDAPAPIVVDVTKLLQGRGEVTLRFGVWERKTVTNYPLQATFGDIALRVDGRRQVVMSQPVAIDYLPTPSDLPLPAAAANLDWTPTAQIVQPWGNTESVAIAEHQVWAPRLADEFGFDAMIVLPPDAHNAITAEPQHLTPELFQEAVDDYRRHGVRLILYSSIMHCGHDPAWQMGGLEKQHPEWSQRDREGKPITLYGHEWLCPSTGALEYCIDYTRKLLQRWHPAAVMLDNNQFMVTADGLPTCYCASCRAAFKQYVVARGGDRVEALYGVTADQLDIPTEPGPLWNLWLHWRNRVWAAATEQFRAALRDIDPKIVLLANTQYQYGTWTLATDLQYPHEDALLSESRSLDSRRMSVKMTLGRALAEGRPLWNYIGTFDEQNYGRLRAPAEVEAICAASTARHANPWIVFYGFSEDPQANAEALAFLARHGRFWRRHATEFARAESAAEVVSLLSYRERNYRGGPLVPDHVGQLAARGVPATGLWLGDSLVTRLGRLGPDHTLVAEGISCLGDDEAAALVAWAERGGTVLATAEVGWRDELGRLRPASAFWSRCGVTRRPDGAVLVGRGRVVWADGTGALLAAAAEQAQPAAVEPASPHWELVPWRVAEPAQLLCHLLWHGPADAVPNATLRLRLPAGATVKTAWLDRVAYDSPQPAQWQADGAGWVALPLERPSVHSLIGVDLGG